MTGLFYIQRYLISYGLNLAVMTMICLNCKKSICEDPQKPPVIRGTGGVRKIRVGFKSQGKSGGARVLYVDFAARGIVGLLYVYPKSEKEDIDENERRILKLMVNKVNENWRNSK